MTKFKYLVSSFVFKNNFLASHCGFHFLQMSVSYFLRVSRPEVLIDLVIHSLSLHVKSSMSLAVSSRSFPEDAEKDLQGEIPKAWPVARESSSLTKSGLENPFGICLAPHCPGLLGRACLNETLTCFCKLFLLYRYAHRPLKMW